MYTFLFIQKNKPQYYLWFLVTKSFKTVITKLLKLRFCSVAISSNLAFKSFGIVMLVLVLVLAILPEGIKIISFKFYYTI
nr:MAG TPA: hypothetical protein [Caudoviricetes sp.]